METLDINDVNLFTEYLRNNSKSIENNVHLSYLIGSPIKLFKDNSFSKKNDALLSLILLIKHQDGTSSFDEIVFNWNSIDLLQTYAKIETSGQLSYLGNLEKYEDMFREKKLKVNPNDIEELTLDDVIDRYHFYSKLTPSLRHKYQNEKFLLFSHESNNYIVPAVEIIRYFYCFSESDSLKQAILHPSGLKLLVNKCTREPVTNKYDLYMETLCEIVDKKKILYFLHNEKYLQMFHSIYFNYMNKGYLTAHFPFEKTFEMVCKTLKFSTNSNTFLVTRIVDSNMLNTFFKTNHIDLHVHHPLSKEREEKTGKRDPSKDRKQKVPREKPSGFNDKLSTTASIPTQITIDEANTNYFPEEEDTSTIETNGKREEQGGITIVIPVKVNDFSTSKGKGNEKQSAQQLKTSNRKFKINQYPSPIPTTDQHSILNMDSIKKNFKKNNFTIDSCKAFYFPDRADGQKRAISYTDSKMKKRRSYIVLSMTKKRKTYLYIDVEPKDTNKEILVLINQTEEIAHKCIYQQVYFGNHKWLAKNEDLNLKENDDFVRIRHSETSKQIVENIIDKLSIKPTLSARN